MVPGPSGGLGGSDGNYTARAELFHLPEQVGAALLGRLAPRAEVRAEILVRLAAPEHFSSPSSRWYGAALTAIFCSGRRRRCQTDPVPVQPAQRCVMIGEPAGQRPGQVRQLARRRERIPTHRRQPRASTGDGVLEPHRARVDPEAFGMHLRGEPGLIPIDAGNRRRQP